MTIQDKPIWNANIEALKRYRKDIYQLISKYSPNNIARVIETDNLPIIIFHSEKSSNLTYDPNQDSYESIKSVEISSYNKIGIYIGMGLGYSPLLLLKERPNIRKIIIIEPSIDLFFLALQLTDLVPIIISDTVHFFIGEPDYQQMTNYIIQLGNLNVGFFILHMPSFEWDPELYNSVKDQAYKILNRPFSEAGSLLNIGSTCFNNRFENLTLLRHAYSLETLKGAFKSLPAIIISAGPSLNQSLPELKKAIGRSILICVDTALPSLMLNNISPDFVVSGDYKYINFEKISQFINHSPLTALVANIYATPLIPKRFPFKYLFFSFQENDSQVWMHKALNIKTLIPVAASVSHMAFGIALIFGSDPIILVGQDLAFTSSKSTHSSGVKFGLNRIPDDQEKDIFWVTDVNGNKVKTSDTYLIFKEIFEKMIKSNPGNYINATNSGAHIEGTKAINIESAINRYMQKKFSVESIIEESVTSTSANHVSNFVIVIKKIIFQVNTAQEELKKILRKVDKIQGDLNQLCNKSVKINKEDDLPIKLKQDLDKIEKINKKMEQNYHIIWQYIQDILNPKVKDNWYFQKKIQESENNLILTCNRIEQNKFIYTARLESIETFKKHLITLMEHLSCETQLFKIISQNKTIKNLLELSQLYIDSGDYILSKNILEDILLKQPDNSLALFQMGVVQSQLLNFEKALEVWEKATLLDPGLLEKILMIRKELALFWFERHKEAWTENIQNDLIHRAVILAGKDPFIFKKINDLWQNYIKSINARLSNNKFDSAIRLLSGWKAAKKILPEWYILQAKCLTGKNDFNSAVEHIKTALFHKPKEAGWIALLARYLIESGQFDEGLKHLQEAVSLDPQTATLWEELGDALFEEKDYVSAVTAYKSCLIALPNMINVLIKIGDCYFSTHQYQAAVSVYQATLEKNQDKSETLKNLITEKILTATLLSNSHTD